MLNVKSQINQISRNSMLAIRLSRNAEELKPFFDKLDAVCEGHIWFEHRKDASISRTHCHGIVAGLTVSVETLRNWLRFETLWAPTDSWRRSDWSFKTSYKSPFGKKPVDAHAITYMSKGHLSPAHRKLFDDWTAYRSAWVQPVLRQKKIDEIDKEEPVLDKQITQWEMLEQVRAILRTKSEPTDDDIIETIIHVHQIHHKMLSRYKVRDFYDSFKAYFGHDKMKSRFMADIISLCIKT